MLSIAEAQAQYEILTALPAVSLPLNQAAGQVLARGLRSLLALPPMNQSAMDGYALRAADLASASEQAPQSLPLAFSIPAGQTPPALPPGHCARIFTGAALPAGADTVVIQEKVDAGQSDCPRFSQAPPLGDNVRLAGEDVRQGQSILPAGLRLNAGSLALAANAGHAYLSCRRRPRATVLVTGDELVAPGKPRGPAQIYESNASYLRHFLQEQGADLQRSEQLPDDLERLKQSINSALQDSDLIIISGGASVGDHDHSRDAVQACGVQERFWKVAQKPGKPLSFGLGPKGQAVFVIPGNPASLYVCAQLHLRHAIARLSGAPAPQPVSARLAQPVQADSRRERLLRVSLRIERAELMAYPLARQASHMISNLAEVQGLLQIPAGRDLAAGSLVTSWLQSELA